MGLIRSGNTEWTPEDDEALTGYLWPIIREIVKTAIENKQNLIIEGCYIPFDWRRGVAAAVDAVEERILKSIKKELLQVDLIRINKKKKELFQMI